MIKFVLDKTLNNIGISRNYLAVEGKIRPATLHEIYHGTAKRLDIETLSKIVETLNKVSVEKGFRKCDVTDVVRFSESEDK